MTLGKKKFYVFSLWMIFIINVEGSSRDVMRKDDWTINVVFFIVIFLLLWGKWCFSGNKRHVSSLCEKRVKVGEIHFNNSDFYFLIEG